MSEQLDPAEIERRKKVAEWLQGERERYEYLLQCAEHAENEELAWETIVSKMTVEDFVTAAKEVLTSRKAPAGLTTEEREFVIWALGYIEGTALEMHDDKTGQQANAIAEKFKQPPAR